MFSNNSNLQIHLSPAEYADSHRCICKNVVWWFFVQQCSNDLNSSILLSNKSKFWNFNSKHSQIATSQYCEELQFLLAIWVSYCFNVFFSRKIKIIWIVKFCFPTIQIFEFSNLLIIKSIYLPQNTLINAEVSEKESIKHNQYSLS